MTASTVAPVAAEVCARANATCLHCGQRMPADRDDEYCCRGCRSVALLLARSGLGRFYDLRGGEGMPVGELGGASIDRKWLEPITTQLAESPAPQRLALDLAGVHCTACVWLLETLFERRGRGVLEVNPALGRAELRIDRDFDLSGFVDDVEAFGYRVGPASETPGTAPSDALLLRAGVALALAGNGMMLSGAIHLGLADGATFSAAKHLSYAAAVLAMLIGAPIFIRSAIEGLRRGAMHLDLPIALGMGLAFLGSTWGYLSGRDANYVDTLTVFVALMLLGRWLKTRILERNQRELLRDPGFEGLLTRRLRGGKAELVPCAKLEPGDVLSLALGDLVPTRAELLDAEASFSFDWIDGESRPRTLHAGAEVPSGAIVAGERAVRARVLEPFRSSEVWALVSGGRADVADDRTLAGLPKNVGAYYVAFVLVAAALAALSTYLRTGDASLTLEIATAALVVTCPCAFGIAVPLAYEVVQGSLRKLGVFVRRPSLFDRALSVRTLLFDKTGTLTTGRLVLASLGPLRALEPRERAWLYGLSARSGHPKSRAVAEALERHFDTQTDEALEVREERGLGLSCETEGHALRLGSARFVGATASLRGTDAASEGDVYFAVDGVVRAVLETREEARAEARQELLRLRNLGYGIRMASGDVTRRCLDVGASLGMAPSEIEGDLSPTDKADRVRAVGADTVMMLGDGLNDAPALATAGCAGTPSIDRPFTATRCDFYFVTPGLEPVTQVLRASQQLARVIRANLAIAFAYNTFAVGLCMVGAMRPWLAALLMPASSIATITFTVLSLRGGRRRWTS